jgi:hypothetical protein
MNILVTNRPAEPGRSFLTDNKNAWIESEVFPFVTKAGKLATQIQIFLT